MTVKLEHHVWRTEDGELVEDGDPRARFLAYTAGEEFTDSNAKQLGLDALAPGRTQKRAIGKVESRSTRKQSS